MFSLHIAEKSQSMDTFRCINCCQSIGRSKGGPKGAARMMTKYSNTFSTLSKCDGNWMCWDCRNVFNHFSNTRSTFLQLSKSISFINKIVNGADAIVNESGIKISCEDNTNQSNDFLQEAEIVEYILPMQAMEAENVKAPDPADSNDDHKIYIKCAYKEKIPVLTICQLTKNEDSQSKNDTSVSCAICHRKFYTEEKKNEHTEAVHKNLVPLFKCKLCSEEFFQKWFYEHHVEVKHCGIQILFSCPVQMCQRTFHNQSELDTHKLSFHRQTDHPLKCNYCHVAYKTKEEILILRDHLIENHLDTNEATAALYNRNYIKAKQKNTVEKKEKCDVPSCPKIFSSPNSTKKCAHILFEHHSQKVCLNCQFEFKCENDLLEHSKKCPFTQCSKCGKKLAHMHVLVHHWDAMHSQNVTFPFNCELCGNDFRYYNNLLDHYSWHCSVAKPKQYDCNKCGKSYRAKHGLKLHLRMIHPQIQPLPSTCQLCNAALFKSERYQMKIHKCGQKNSPQQLGNRMNSLRNRRAKFKPMSSCSTESVDKNKCKLQKDKKLSLTKVEISSWYCSESSKFICQRCGQPLIWKSDLIRHLRVSHQVEGYTDLALTIRGTTAQPTVTCPHCPEQFCRRDLLRRHITQQHALTSKEFCPKTFQCKDCGKTTSTRMLYAHSERHCTVITHKSRLKEERDLNEFFNDDEKLLMCPECNEKFSNTPQFVEHCKTKHRYRVKKKELETVYEHKCPMLNCKRSFPWRLLLRYHLKNHRQTKVKI